MVRCITKITNIKQTLKMKEKNTDKQLSNALYVLLCLVRLPLTFIIAIPCYFLVLPFWLLGIKNPWQKMTRLFDELAFNR